MNRNGVYIRVLLVVLAIVVLIAFVNRSPRHLARDTWVPSSYNPVGAGHMAFYETLQALHWPVERWREPLSRLDRYGTGNTLILARSRVGFRVGFSDQEDALLDSWVKKGNTLLLMGAFEDWEDTRQLLRQMGFSLLPKRHESVADFLQPWEPEETEQIRAQAAAHSGQTGTLVLPPSTPLPLGFPRGTRMLWMDSGEPYLLDVPLGAGHALYAASSQILSNSYLKRGDNLAIVLRLLAPHDQVPPHLFFEESHHGYNAVFALARLLDHPGVRFAGMLTLLGALTFLGSSLVRFGPVLPSDPTSGRSTLEFIDSIADLYQHADLRNDTVQYLFHETHQRILQRLNLPPTASHELIASRLKQTHPRLPGWKKLAQRFDSRDHVAGLPPAGWFRVTRELIQIKAAMV